MDMEQLERIKKSFTEEQQKVYDVLLGDIEKLHGEWVLCRRMYDSASAIIEDKYTGQEVRRVLRIASTDYWNRRRLALERTMEILGMNANLSAWRKEYSDAKGK